MALGKAKRKNKYRQVYKLSWNSGAPTAGWRKTSLQCPFAESQCWQAVGRIDSIKFYESGKAKRQNESRQAYKLFPKRGGQKGGWKKISRSAYLQRPSAGKRWVEEDVISSNAGNGLKSIATSGNQKMKNKFHAICVMAASRETRFEEAQNSGLEQFSKKTQILIWSQMTYALHEIKTKQEFGAAAIESRHLRDDKVDIQALHHFWRGILEQGDVCLEDLDFRRGKVLGSQLQDRPLLQV